MYTNFVYLCSVRPLADFFFARERAAVVAVPPKAPGAQTVPNQRVMCTLAFGGHLVRCSDDAMIAVGYRYSRYCVTLLCSEGDVIYLYY